MICIYVYIYIYMYIYIYSQFTMYHISLYIQQQACCWFSPCVKLNTLYLVRTNHTPWRCLDPNQDSNMQSGANRHDLHSVVCLAIFLTNQELQPKKEGTLRPASFFKQEAFFYVQAKDNQDVCFARRRYIVKFHAWESQQHAEYCIRLEYTFFIYRHGKVFFG